MYEILLKLMMFLTSNSFSLANELQAPLTENVIRNKLDELKKPIPEDLITLYKWKNGISFSGAASPLFDYCYLYNLDAAIDDYKRFQKLDILMASGNDYSYMLPICLSGSGEYYFICFSNERKGQIFYHSAGEFNGELVLAFKNLQDMFNSILECYSQKIYTYNLNGKWQIDFLKQESLMQELNPGCRRWLNEDDPDDVKFIHL